MSSPQSAVPRAVRHAALRGGQPACQPSAAASSARHRTPAQRQRSGVAPGRAGAIVHPAAPCSSCRSSTGQRDGAARRPQPPGALSFQNDQARSLHIVRLCPAAARLCTVPQPSCARPRAGTGAVRPRRSETASERSLTIRQRLSDHLRVRVEQAANAASCQRC